MRRKTGRIGLVALLSTAFALLVLLTVGLSGLIGWWGVRRATLDLLDEKGVASIRQLELGLSDQLLSARLLVEAIGRLLEEGRLEASDRRALAAVQLAGLASNPQLSALVFVSSDFRETSARRDPTSGPAAVERDGAASATLKARLERARDRTGTWWGEPLFAERLEGAVVNVRHSVWRDGVFLGFVGAAITTTKLREQIADLAGMDGARAIPFVLYGRDRVLAYAGDGPATPNSPDDPLPKLESVSHPALASIWSAAPATGLQRAASRGIEAGRVTTPVGAYLILHKQVIGFGEKPWTIGIVLPDEELKPYFESLRRTGYAALALTFLGGLAALLIGRLIGNRIRRVVRNASHVAAMDLDAVRELPPSDVAELDSLARAFNRMLTALRAFEAYVPKSLVNRLIHSGTLGDAASRERDLTVMFTDIVGFTHAAESMSARSVAEFLNAHFALLAACVEAEGGTVDKYLGDGMMAFWGAPERLKQRAARACRTALAVRNAIRADNLRRATLGQPPVRLRIGLHRGPLVVGNIGAPGRINYTVVGDTVNVAQRLQDFGRTLDPSADVIIVASSAIVVEVRDSFVFDDAGTADLKGRIDTIRAYQLVDSVASHQKATLMDGPSAW